MKSKVFSTLLKNKLTTDAGTYMGFNILEKLVPFIVLPIISRYLSKEDMGIYIVYQTFIALLLPFISLNTDSAILINFFKLNNRNFKIYFFNALLVFSISFILVVIIFLIWPNYLSNLLEFPQKWFAAVVLIVVFTYFVRLTLNLWQIEKKPIKYGIFSLTLTLLKGGLLLLFVVQLKKGWSGVIVSQLIAYSLMFLLSTIVLFYYRKIVSFSYNRLFIKDTLKVGVPLTLHQVGGWLGSQSNRLIINILIGSAATGSFGIGAIYGTIVSVIQNAFNRAFTPYLFENLQRLNTKIRRKLVKLTYLYNISLVVFALFVGTIGFFINDYLFGKDYNSSKIFIFWMVLGNAFNGLYKMHVNYIFFTKKTIYILIITLTLGVINVVLSYIFINLYGAVAGAIVFMLTQFFGYIAAWYFGNRLIPMPWFGNNTVYSNG